MKIIRPKISEIPGLKSNKTEISGDKFSNFLGAREVVLSFENCGKRCFIAHWRFLEMHSKSLVEW